MSSSTLGANLVKTVGLYIYFKTFSLVLHIIYCISMHFFV